MKKNKVQIILFGFILFIAGQLSASSSPHVLVRIPSPERKQLNYVCRLATSYEEISAKISINLQTQFMEVELAEGVVVKGSASSSFNCNTGITSFFLQGGTEPRAQQLLLSIRNEGEWAEFQRTYGGYTFVCQ
jgi:hypothetical protein